MYIFIYIRINIYNHTYIYVQECFHEQQHSKHERQAATFPPLKSFTCILTHTHANTHAHAHTHANTHAQTGRSTASTLETCTQIHYMHTLTHTPHHTHTHTHANTPIEIGSSTVDDKHTNPCMHV